MELREYQKAAIHQLRQSYKNGKKRVLFVSPTGSGKTRMAVEVVTGALEKKQRILWLTHRRELLYQAVERLKREGVKDLGIFLANESQTAPQASVQVASVDTLRARSIRPEASFVIWDEAHHIAAETWADLQALYPEAYHLGLTATPERGDGKPLGEFFDDLVVGATVPELQEMGYLVPCVVEAPPKKLDSYKMAQSPLDAWREKAAGLQTILYASTVEEAYRYAKEFKEAGIKAEAIESQTPIEQRQDILRRFAQGRLTVLCNVAILTEGWDCPPAAVCLVARTVGTVGLWLQMVGRVLRPTKQKDYALILDLVGNVHEHGPPDLPREFSRQLGIVTPASSRVADTRCPQCKALSVRRPCPSCGYVPTRREKEITGDRLIPFESLPTEVQTTQLQALVEFAEEQHFKPGWVYYEFRKRYHSELPQETYRSVYQQIRQKRPLNRLPGFSGFAQDLLEGLVLEAIRTQKSVDWVWQVFQQQCQESVPVPLYQDMVRLVSSVRSNTPQTPAEKNQATPQTPEEKNRVIPLRKPCERCHKNPRKRGVAKKKGPHWTVYCAKCGAYSHHASDREIFLSRSIDE